MFGRPVERRGSVVDEIVNPTKPSQSKNQDDVTVEIRRLQNTGNGLVPTQASRSSFGDAFSEQELASINQITGELIFEQWDRVVKDSKYKTLSDADKKRVLDRANDAVFLSVKSEYIKDINLTKFAKAYINDKNVDWFGDFETTEPKKPKVRTDKQVPKLKKPTKARLSKKSVVKAPKAKKLKLALGTIKAKKLKSPKMNIKKLAYKKPKKLPVKTA